MDESAIPVEVVYEQLCRCAICYGYLLDTGRYPEAERVLADGAKFVNAFIGPSGIQGATELVDRAVSEKNLWIQYFSAIHISRIFPTVAIDVFASLARQNIAGTVAADSLLAMSELRNAAGAN
jgi:hypothetical protein